MGNIYSTLDEVLAYLDITANFLAVEAKIRPHTIYAMKDDQSERFNKETLEKILDALNLIAKEKGIKRTFNIEDILTYKK